MRARLAILAAFILVLVLPLFVRALSPTWGSAAARRAPGQRALVIITPHVEQISSEFGQAFVAWHERVYREKVFVDWRGPLGTSEIMKQLEAQSEAAARRGDLKDDGSFEKGSAGFDIFFGGGSYEHSKMKSVHTLSVRGRDLTYRMGRPAGFEPQQLKDWYGENKIGSQKLYDPDQYWFGAALSGFGIVYNKPVLAFLHLTEPHSFSDLTDPRYINMLDLADARLSGSVATTYESILNKEGWDRGWRILRDMCGNARYFASSSTKPPIDVGQGEGAAGLAIDFYGRGQAQSLIPKGGKPEDSRVGYVNPAGAVFIDADPVSILNGATDPELAKRFIEFCLSEEGQALWQFHVRGSSPKSDAPLGPVQYELRRMPVRRVMYEKYLDYMIDKSNPFEDASELPNRGWRDSIAPLMAAFGVDTAPECRAAWRALSYARVPIAKGDMPKDCFWEMERLFYAMPTHTMRQGTIWWPAEITKELSKDDARALELAKVTTFMGLEQFITRNKADHSVKPESLATWDGLLAKRAQYENVPAPQLEFSETTYRAIRNDTDSWKDPTHGRRSLIAYATFFRDNYARIVELYKKGPSAN